MTPIELVEHIQRRAQESRAIVTPYSFGELANMYLHDELVIDPDYQRLFRWQDDKQSQFLESLLLELPLPPLFLIQLPDETYEVADGLQRLGTYLRFSGAFKEKPPTNPEFLERIKDPLVLEECDLVPELNGMTYDSLPSALVIRLRRSRIDCSVTKLGSDPTLRYYIFKRLNSGGEPLTPQESRSSFTRMLNPRAVDFITDLSKNPDFEVTIRTITSNQRDQRFNEELVLRFLALYKNSGNFKHDVAPFLTDFLESLAREEHDFSELESIFSRTFSILANNLGEEAFTLADKTQFSVLHFEGIALATASLIVDDELNEQGMKDQVSLLKQDPGFRAAAVGGGKNAPSFLRKRVDRARDFLKR